MVITQAATGEMMMKRFYVETRVPEFEGCKSVLFTWFNARPVRGQRPYAGLIEGYDPKDDTTAYAEGIIDELFTEEEALQLKSYIQQEKRYVHSGGVTTLREVQIPIPNNSIGFGAMPVGGGNDFLVGYERPNYPLPFKVVAYYDLVGRELVDGSGVYHHRCMIVSPEGVRMQTNEEAAADAKAALASRLIPDGLPF
jgi:hypothetical protein